MTKKRKTNGQTKTDTHMLMLKQFPKLPKVNMTASAVGMGAVVGAMAGSAVGYALADRKRRELMLSKMDQLKNYVIHTLDDMAKEIKEEEMQTAPSKRKIRHPTHTQAQ